MNRTSQKPTKTKTPEKHYGCVGQNRVKSQRKPKRQKKHSGCVEQKSRVKSQRKPKTPNKKHSPIRERNHTASRESLVAWKTVRRAPPKRSNPVDISLPAFDVPTRTYQRTCRCMPGPLLPSSLLPTSLITSGTFFVLPSLLLSSSICHRHKNACKKSGRFMQKKKKKIKDVSHEFDEFQVNTDLCMLRC